MHETLKKTEQKETKETKKGGRTETSRTENVRLIFTSGLAHSQLDSFVPFVSFCSILRPRSESSSIHVPALPRQDRNPQQNAVPGKDLQTATLQPTIQTPECTQADDKGN